MSKRKYTTRPTMFVSQYPTINNGVVQPDAKLISSLHRLLDQIDNENHALMIDSIVADLLRFHQPAYQAPGTATLVNKRGLF